MSVQIPQFVQKPPPSTNFEQFEQIEHASEPYEAGRRSVGAPEPMGRWMLLVQRWGASVVEAAKIVNDLCTAAGVPGTERRAHVGDLFAKLERYRVGTRRKVEWLKAETIKMQRDSLRWPASRPDRAAAGRIGPESMLRVMRRDRKRRWTKDELRRATGFSKVRVTNLVSVMTKEGEIIRVSLGVYALPESGAERHVPACEAAVTVFLMAPDNQASVAELIAATGLKRHAITAACKRMIEKGVLVRRRSDVFVLSPNTLTKIRRGDAMRIGLSVLQLPQKDARAASTSDA
jgi:hypothetical protein